MKFRLFASMVLAATLALFSLSAPAYACACYFGTPEMSITTSEVAGRIQVELKDDGPHEGLPEVKYLVSIYSDEAKSNLLSENRESAGVFLTPELEPATTYWVEARATAKIADTEDWQLSTEEVTDSAVSGSVSSVVPELSVSPSSVAGALHISIGDPNPETWYHIEISGTADFAGMAWFHTTPAKEFDVELPASQTFFVRITRVYWDSVKLSAYPIGLAAVSSSETSASNADARLGGLFIEGVELNEPFSPDVFSYIATVPAETESISLSAAALNPNSVMTLGNNPLAQKEMSSVDLSYEDNSLVVDVTSADATETKQYLILVNRQVPKEFYIKGGVVSYENAPVPTDEVKRTFTGSDSDVAEPYVVDTPVEPEPTQMPSTGGEESQSGAAPMDDTVAAGESSASVWIFSSVAVLLLAGLGIGLARRRKV
jgi:hypothetical protein